jgi:ubiquinone/menaquinone biosynthesis C-methylase UbiE
MRSNRYSSWWRETKIKPSAITDVVDCSAIKCQFAERTATLIYASVLKTLIFLFGLFVTSLYADDHDVASATAIAVAPRVADRERPKEKPRRSYLGRIVAQPMSHLGASWLVRPEREQEESVREAYDQLQISAGMTVVDMGCGNGFWSIPLARAVGESGRVLAVDIQREMLIELRKRAEREEIKNIEPIHGGVDDPKLPEKTADITLLVDVYHEFSHPESMLWSIRRSLKPTGVIALLEYREEDPTVPIKPLHKMSKLQIIKEYEHNGLKLVREYNKLPWQHLMFFARDDSPLEKIEPIPGEQVVVELHKQP